MNFTGLEGIYLSVHDKGAYVPSNAKKLGMDMLFMGTDKSASTAVQEQIFNIKVKERTYLPTDEFPCIKDNTRTQVTPRQCWMRYVQETLECLVPRKAWVNLVDEDKIQR